MFVREEVDEDEMLNPGSLVFGYIGHKNKK